MNFESVSSAFRASSELYCDINVAPVARMGYVTELLVVMTFASFSFPERLLMRVYIILLLKLFESQYTR